MRYATLAASKLSVSKLTFGCWELGGGQWEKQSDETNIEAIQTALELGITSFDTAEGYGQGHSEEVLGEALEGKRDNCVIASKVSPEHLRADDIERSVERSLRRLRTDVLDIYYIHRPNPEVALTQTLSTLNRLREQGVIRAIGLSNFSMAELEQAVHITPIDVIQPEYSLLQRSIEPDILPLCRVGEMGVLTYSSIAKGILSGAYHFGRARVEADDFRVARRMFLPEHLEAEQPLVELVGQVADTHHVTPAQVAIAWMLQQPGITSAIVGSQNVAHLRDNARAADLALTAEQLSRLDALSREVIARIDGTH